MVYLRALVRAGLLLRAFIVLHIVCVSVHILSPSVAAL